jgi:predicted HicB family RNase H-like nuclease
MVVAVWPISFRLPWDLVDPAREAASEAGLSLNAWLVQAVRDKLDRLSDDQ